MPSVFDVLKKDHEEVKEMLDELQGGPVAATGAQDDQLALRKKMAEQLVIDNSRHEAVEEMHFWPTVRDKVPGGDQLADKAIGQEQEGKEVLHKLDKAQAHEPEFEELLSTFNTAAREHIAFEETQVWPKLREVLSAEEADELGKKIQESKKTAPTRPHPNAPDSPGALKSTGPAVAAADKLRDAATGRGE
jgi:hemerythrin-like domain-containing protein